MLLKLCVNGDGTFDQVCQLLSRAAHEVWCREVFPCQEKLSLIEAMYRSM